MKSLWTAILVLGSVSLAAAKQSAPPADVEEDTPGLTGILQRLAVLEQEKTDQEDELERLKRQAEEERKKEMEDLPSRVSRLEKQVFQPTWNPEKGLAFSSSDGDFTAKVGGRIYANYRHIFDRNDTTGGAADTFFLDTARIQLDGSFYKDFFYRVEGEAQTASDSGRFRMKDVYVGINAIPDALTIQFGQMKVPMSQEETCSSRFIDFGERSLLNRIVPGHGTGLLAKGSLDEKKMFEYCLGVFSGGTTRDADRNATDANDEKDLAARLFVTPLRGAGMHILDSLRFALDYQVGNRDRVALGSGITDGDLGGLTINPFSAGAGINADGDQTRLDFGLSWIYGPMSIRAESLTVNTELSDAAPESSFDMDAWYVQFTYLLTGEDKPLENRVKPAANFKIADGTWGAWELALRFANLDSSDGVGAGVVGATANAETRELTIGLNWWWTPNVALRMDWERLTFDKDLPVSSAADPNDDHQDILYFRWQIDF